MAGFLNQDEIETLLSEANLWDENTSEKPECKFGKHGYKKA